MFKNLGAGFFAVHDGHVDIEDDQVEIVYRVIFDCLKGLLPIDDLVYLVKVLLKRVSKESEQEVVVVRQQASIVWFLMLPVILSDVVCRYTINTGLLLEVQLDMVLDWIKKTTSDEAQVFRAATASWHQQCELLFDFMKRIEPFKKI